MPGKAPVSPDDEELNPTPVGEEQEPEIGDEIDIEEEFDVDLSGMADVKEGKYAARCVSLDGNAESSGGKPQYDFEYELCEYDRTMHNYISKGATSRWKLIEALKGHGVPIEGEAIKFKRSDVLVKCPIVILDLKNETYQGETRLKIKKVLPADAATRERFATNPDQAT